MESDEEVDEESEEEEDDEVVSPKKLAWRNSQFSEQISSFDPYNQKDELGFEFESIEEIEEVKIDKWFWS